MPLPDRGACSGLDRRTVPIDAAPYRTGHVVGAGGTFWTISGHEVSVGETPDETGAYPVTVRPIDVLAWHYTPRADPDESGQEDPDGATGEADEDEKQEDLNGAAGDADEDEEQEGTARTSADLISGEQDFGSKYGVVSLNVSCSEGLVGVVLYSWNDYIDRDVARGAATARAVHVTYRFGEESDPQQARWSVTGGGQGARAPAAAIGELVGGLLEQEEPLHVTARAVGGTQAGSATFPVATDTGAIERVLADCGAEPAGPVPGRRLDLTDRRERRPRGAAAVRGPDLLRARPSGAVPPDAGEALRGVRRAATHRQRHPRRYGNLQRRGRPGGRGPPLRHREHRGARLAGPQRDTGFRVRVRSRGFLSDLQDHDRLVLRVRDPAGRVLATVTFASLAGAAEAITPVLGACR